METFILYGDTGDTTRLVMNLLKERQIVFTFSLVSGNVPLPVLSTPIGRVTGIDEIRRFLQWNPDEAAHSPCAF